MTSDTLPPYNLEAELCTLGSMLLDNSTIEDISVIVKAEDFYRDSHQTLYKAILALREGGSAVDAILLVEALQRDGRLSDVGGDETIVEILKAPPHAGNATYYAQIVQQKAISRSLIECGHRLIRDGYSNLYSADDLLERAESAVYAIGDDRGSAGSASSFEALDDFTAKLDRRMMGEVTGLASGIRVLDDLTDGFQPGSLTIVGARPSMGKSALTLNIVDHVTVNLSINAFFVSMEMPKGELMERMVCTRAEVDSKTVRNAYKLKDFEKFQIEVAVQTLREHRFHIDDSGNQTVAKICANARRLKSRNGIGLVVVDYLQLVESDGEGDSRQEQVAKISRRLKQLAMDLDIPVIAVSQLNRQAEGREDKRPRMSDLRESGAIEQDADVVILLHRPEYYDANDQQGIAEIQIAKNRNGAVGTARLEFRKAITKFNSL